MSSEASQPVVQTILESFSRCFSPSPDFSCVNGGGGPRSPSGPRRPSSKRSSPTRAASRLELNDKEWDDVFEGGGGGDSRRRRSSSSRSGPRDDGADVVARAKKAARRLDPETIERRSLKRRLEIFRTRGSDPSEPPPRRPPEPRAARTATPEELVATDSSEEEIADLASSRKRFACGFGGDADRLQGPIASFARFFNLGPQPNPFGLCFATPVRTASAERPSKFPDHQLTAEEFLRRHAHPGADAPDLEFSRDGSDSPSGEDDTITSTLYFDHKYAHLPQTRPPMPLFRSQAVPCHDCRSDELTKIIRRKAMRPVQPSPPRLLTAKVSKSRKGASGSPRGQTTCAAADCPPSPMHISDKGSLSSTNSREGSWRPDILHDTAAEI